MNNVCVVGGGTAGWLTALLTKQFYPSKNVIVVASDEIGILGAGEGTVPHFIEILGLINISVSELIRECGATIKLGARFVNWKGDDQSYLHSFDADYGLSERYLPQLMSYQIANDGKINDIAFVDKLTKSKKTAFQFINNDSVSLNDPLFSFYSYARYALHFDARSLAKYLKQVALSRGIYHVDTKVTSFSNNEDGDIVTIHSEDGDIPVEFVFDCTGFARLIIGKHHKADWLSYKEYLPLDKAIPFFIDHDNDVEPETQAIAMKYGWVWKIPVQDRFGCGYVFDSSYINEEGALKEAEEYFGRSLTSPTTFSFNPGTFKQTVVNNCMAVGLAQSFFEPLEATSIWASMVNLRQFLESDMIHKKSDTTIDYFNEVCLHRNETIRDFIRLHYITKRNDSPFWSDLPDRCPIPKDITKKIEMLNDNLECPFDSPTFFKTSWIQVIDGQGLFDTEKMRTQYNIFKEKNPHYDVDVYLKSFLANQKNMMRSCLTHKEFIDYVKGV